jgi:LysM repeat protein
LSSFFGGQIADAKVASTTVNTPQSQTNNYNSQSSDLALQVSDPSQVNNISDDSDTSSNTPIDSTGTAINAPTGPMGVSDGKNIYDTSDNNTTSVYVVRNGDSISQIATMFGVSVDTILWANDMKKGDKLTTGEVLLILPVSGIEHTVTKGQTLQKIANLYKVDVNDIVQSNDITLDTPLSAGETLIIPNGEEKSVESNTPIPEKDLGASIAKDKLYYEQHPTQSFPGYYIDPVPGYRLSQGIHDNNAVDLAIAPGTPIHAAAEGTVVLARYGYNGGFGNVVIIDHPNGTQTLYAHQSKLATTTGAEVSQGEIIGYVGSTGHSTGPHLHFEVHGAQNPGADDSWASFNY